MARLVEFTRFYDPEEALCAQSYLRSLGIETLAQNENHLSMVPYLRLALGGFILLGAEDLQLDARNALSDVQRSAPSIEPDAEDGDWRPKRNWLFLPIAFWGNAPFLPRYRTMWAFAFQTLMLLLVLVGGFTVGILRF